jgi:hypothetical protein
MIERHGQKLTHKGWLGLCPVYLADIRSESPFVVERHWTAAPLMLASRWIYRACFVVAELMNPEWEPEWPLRVTGRV